MSNVFDMTSVSSCTHLSLVDTYLLMIGLAVLAPGQFVCLAEPTF